MSNNGTGTKHAPSQTCHDTPAARVSSTHKDNAVEGSQAAAVAFEGAGKVLSRHGVLALRVQHLERGRREGPVRPW